MFCVVVEKALRMKISDIVQSIILLVIQYEIRKKTLTRTCEFCYFLSCVGRFHKEYF